MTVPVDLRGGDWLDDNRANWDERVPLHVASDFYHKEPLRRGEGVLDPIARAGIERMHPDGLDGLRVLHLQCHFGSDTLSLANRFTSMPTRLASSKVSHWISSGCASVM